MPKFGENRVSFIHVPRPSKIPAFTVSFPHFQKLSTSSQGGTSTLRGQGGSDLASSLEAKFGAMWPNKRKNLGKSVNTRGKNWGYTRTREDLIRIHNLTTQILGSYLKFKGKIWGSHYLYFRRQNLGSDTNFRGKIWGGSPWPLNVEVPPGILIYSLV